MIKIDKKDLLLLAELDQNSRQSLSLISKKLAIPEETIRYRFQRLIKEQIIKNFITVIDGGKLGFYYYKVFFKFYNINEHEIQDVIKYLIAKEEVTWIIRTDGIYDISFTINAKNPIELFLLTEELRNKYYRIIHKWTYSVNIQMDFLTRKYLSEIKTKKLSSDTYKVYNQTYEIDDIDWKIIKELSLYTRESSQNIGKKLNLSGDAISLRIKKLEKNSVIIRHSIVLNVSLLKYVNHYVLIFLNKIDKDRRIEFEEYLRNQKNIVYIIRSLGDWDYEINIESINITTYRNIMMELTTKFSDIVRDYTGMFVDEIHKYKYP